MKKAQGLSLNTIIIAAIVLIVLVVLWAIFTGRMGVFTKGVKEEEKRAQEEAKKFEKLAVGGVSVGQSCKTGDTPRCGDGNVLRCGLDNKWEVQFNCGDRGCDEATNTCK